MDIKQAKHHLTGPVMSLRTPFDAEGEIDFPAVRKIIDRGISGGVKTVMLTAGDSHYECLQDSEIGELTRAVVEHTGRRAMVIAADRYFATKAAVAFARECRDLGADMFMALPPDWGHSTTPETLAEHYAAIAEIMPVMIVTNRFIQRGLSFGLETIERTFDSSPNVIAVKDDMCGTFAHDLCMRFNDRAAIIAGGQKRNHMNMHPYGCAGYLSTFATYAPEIARGYWLAIETKDIAAATQIIREKDVPFFNYVGKVTGGFDAAMHGMLELYGIGQRFRRKPYHTMTDGELDLLREFLVAKGLLNP